MSAIYEPQIWRFDNANALYYALTDALKTEVQLCLDRGKKPVLALPTGNTMIPFYRIATDQAEALKISEWQCFNLDEYYPVDDQNESLSFSRYMDRNFYSRLQTPVAFSSILNGRAPDPEAECARYEALIAAKGGIDIAILGLGTNGHIAFNEPTSEFDSRTRLIELHQQTLIANFSIRSTDEEKFTHAMTMGIGTILEAKKIIVVALGKTKTNAVRNAILEIESRTCPASGLRRNPNVTWFLDQEASALI